MPYEAKASIIASLFGSRASAGIVDSIGGPEEVLPEDNSQNMYLLQANASLPLLALQEKGAKGTDDGVGGPEASAGTATISEDALMPLGNPVSAEDEEKLALDGDPNFDQISVYVVRTGDSISQIAEMFDVSVNTVLWANDLKRNAAIKPGDVLFILPVSGVEHTVVKGDTVQSIAKKYKADASDVAGFNGISENEKLVIGEKIIVPGGEIYYDAPATSSLARISAKTTYVGNLPNVTGYFHDPLPAKKRISQGLHGKNGVDFAAPTGTPILASAGGVVLIARTGYNGGYGGMVVIQHPNGTQTLYAHMSRLGTYNGAVVNQGDLIGYVGSTGRSTGPHLHFEVRGAKNPGATNPTSFATN